jgi:ABC-type cobalt transport system substrate-binding protein
MKRFKHLLTIVLVVTLADFEFASAYEPAVQWQKTFGGSDREAGGSVQKTSDGGYIIAGATWSFGAGGADAYLIKTDPNGNLLWQKTFGGSNDDTASSVQQTADDGYIIAGSTWSFGAGNDDVYLIKTDSDGNPLWQKTFGSTDCEIGRSVQETSDAGFIILANYWNSCQNPFTISLIKTDSEGNLQSQKDFHTGSLLCASSFGQTSDGGFVITGYGLEEVYLIKTDSSGNLQWQKTFGGTDTRGWSVQQTSDGGFVIAGETESFGAGGADAYLIKTDPNGNLLWQKTFGGTDTDRGWSVQQTSDGGFVIGAETKSFGAGQSDVYLIKTDSAGNTEWQKTFGGSDREAGGSVQKTSDGGYIIAGRTRSFGAGNEDVYLIKLSSEVCEYVLFGDVTNDCRFDFYDFAMMAANWLIDCNIAPNNPACISR